MLPFYGIFLLWALGAIQFSSNNAKRYEGIFYAFTVFLTILMVGLRYEVGGDWETYLAMYQDLYYQPLYFAVRYTDPAYGLLNWASSRFEAGIWPINLVCAIVFIYGISTLANQQNNRWLFFTVAIPYLIIVVGMGYTRQAAAIGVICWTISNTSSSRPIQTILGIAVAALFHKTAILFLPIILVPTLMRRPIYAVFGAIVFAVLGVLLLGKSSDTLVDSYINSQYQSSGAAIRISMNVLAAFVFLLNKNKYSMESYIKEIWAACAYLSIISVFGLLTASSSVGVDRLSLFLIPIQLVTYSGLPYALSRNDKPVISILLIVIIYSFIVEYTYFNFADFSWAWQPYQNLLTSDLTVHRR